MTDAPDTPDLPFDAVPHESIVLGVSTFHGALYVERLDSLVMEHTISDISRAQGWDGITRVEEDSEEQVLVLSSGLHFIVTPGQLVPVDRAGP